jgi:hypothetical protein
MNALSITTLLIDGRPTSAEGRKTERFFSMHLIPRWDKRLVFYPKSDDSASQRHRGEDQFPDLLRIET